MKLRITIDIFSGRENPVIELTGKAAQDAISRLQPKRKIEKGEMGLPPSPSLGYRGMIIEQVDEPVKGLPKTFVLANGSVFGAKLAHMATDEAFEDFICGSTGPITKLDLGKKFQSYLKVEIERFKTVRLQWPWDGHIIWPPLNPCACAPLYEPNWWNDNGQKQFHNNCYNYSTNYRSDTFAQPGRAAGAMYGALTCASVKPAAVKDALIDSPAANNKCPAEGHLVALVIAPGWDFHWYRKGRNGFWSHKPGSTQVTNIDNAGAPIPDPRTANRGPYTDFCTFMVVMHGHIKIS